MEFTKQFIVALSLSTTQSPFLATLRVVRLFLGSFFT